MLRVVSIQDLQPGMYVNEVTQQTGNFKVKSKGLVKTQRTIDSLRDKGVLEVQVDMDKSHLVQNAPAAEGTPEKEAPQPGKSPTEQMSHAQKLADQAIKVQRTFYQKIKRDGKAELDTMQSLSNDVVECVIECPSALSCLSLLNRSDNYYLEHSLNCSTLMAMFANHLDADKQTVRELTFAALIMDVGMANIPPDIIGKKGPLTEAEREIVTTHVDIGVDIIQRCAEVSELVRDIVFSHHERINGSGYPQQKTGKQLSQYVQMAGIVDSYDAMTSVRPYRAAMSPTRALKQLMTDARYDKALVQKFVQCMGVHPVGSLVKLDNDRLGIVVRANAKNPLRPVVITFYHVKSALYSETKLVDLRWSEAQIESSVRPEEFGLNLSRFFRDVLVNNLG